MKNLVLYFFLLVLRVFFNFILDAIYKSNRFIKILLKKDFKFILSRVDNIVLFYLSFILLPAKIDFLLEEQGHKKNMLIVCDISYVKINPYTTNKNSNILYISFYNTSQNFWL